MTFTIRNITTSQELQQLEAQWNLLAGDVPMHSWEWSSAWWRHYSQLGQRSGQPPRRKLNVLAIFSPADRQLVGIVPLLLEQTAAKGQLLRLLGTGEVCTDHLTLLVSDQHRDAIADAIAEHLTAERDDWDRLELSSVADADVKWQRLVTALQDRNCDVTTCPADACWQIALPATWDEFLLLQSKSHRKQLRRAENRLLKSGRAVWHQVNHEDQFQRGWEVLVDLHQRRRQSLGERGCFASRPFHGFHADVAWQLLKRNQLRLSWLELDGSPIAAEYHFASGTTTYAYQGGLDPDRLEDEPGRLSTILCLQAAIEEGHTTFDFLRGDEPYKAHWRATPRSTVDYLILPDRHWAKVRGRVLQSVGAVTEWLKMGDTAAAGTSKGSV